MTSESLSPLIKKGAILLLHICEVMLVLWGMASSLIVIFFGTWGLGAPEAANNRLEAIATITFILLLSIGGTIGLIVLCELTIRRLSNKMKKG